jgi:4-hydroxythreonine-4-phosphate dehydrogenase
MGDASGVGPEILLRAFAGNQIRVPVVAFGDVAALEVSNQRLNFGVKLRAIERPEAAVGGVLSVVDSGLLTAAQVTPGRLSKAAGAAARDYVVRATRAALAGEISAMVTLPMNKEATQLSDPDFVGHTELIGGLCGASDVTILLASDALVVTHVSTHCSLAEAIRRARKERIETIIQLTCEAMARLKDAPRVAVAGLNPHAGENGLFGDEEIREIRPAVEWAQRRGLPVEGPLPPDTLFYLAVRRKRYDAIVCMYHDQGHVPLKLLDFENGVNVALGLPIIRTSVDHGTAFDIAGTGKASAASFLRALDFAAKLAEKGPLGK